MKPKRIQSKLSNLLQNRECVVAAYLFGSIARNTDNVMSDIDIAILIDDSENIVSEMKELAELISDVLDTSSLDLISLRHADLALRYNVIRDGILIYEMDPVLRIAFERITTAEYLDMLPAWSLYDEHLKMRLQEYVPSD